MSARALKRQKPKRLLARDERAAAKGGAAVRADLFGTVFLLAQHLARRADTALAPLGLTTAQWLLLAVLARKFPGQAPTLSEAALWHGSSRQNVKQLARQLEARGFLRFVVDPADRRALRLEPTARLAVFNRPGERARQGAFLAEVFATLTLAEQRHLLGLVMRWLAALAPPNLIEKT